MLELTSIVEFSHVHCIGICAVLVPVSLLLTNITMLLVAFNRSTRAIRLSVAIATLPAIALLLHVLTWWAIGVVMLPTFILPILATICLATNAYATIDPAQMRNLIIKASKFSVAKYQQLITN